MNGGSVALDTSVAIDVLAGRAESLTTQAITEFLLPVPVIGELRYGALNSRKADENLQESGRFLGILEDVSGSRLAAPNAAVSTR